MDPLEIPGCSLIGYIRANNINGGKPIPLFDPKTQPGRLDINTLEGWNAFVDKSHRDSFRRRFGREPASNSELDHYVQTGACFP